MSPSPDPFPVLHLLLERDNNTAPANTTDPGSTNTTKTDNATVSPTPIPQTSHGLSVWAIVLIIVLVLIALSGAAYAVWRFRFRHTPASTGFQRGPIDSVKNWFAAATYKFRNPRNRTGAGFEGISAGAAGVGVGSRDVDAWDARVHDDEEYGIVGGGSRGFEMGPTRFSSEYRGSGHNPAGSRYRDEDVREYDEREHGGRGRGPIPAENPFGDEHAAKDGASGLGIGQDDRLRSVSPRPILGVDTHNLEPSGGASQGGSRQGSPTRRSVFREEI